MTIRKPSASSPFTCRAQQQLALRPAVDKQQRRAVRLAPLRDVESRLLRRRGSREIAIGLAVRRLRARQLTSIGSLHLVRVVGGRR